ncbi:MAG TPA: Gfo/Idh/MocA family oxidoreductase [Kofleriaceae bacterium]|nr:Gfo/Idh/MocA family oxidoreductase [Kofleriaceae bacterium]
MTPIRFAVIGAGAWGINHVRVVAARADCRLVAVVDPDRGCWDRVRALAPGAALHADPDAALAGDADAIVIASPAPTHAAFAHRAIEAGKHVLIEKPIALSLADARALRERVRGTSSVAMAGHLMLFHPAVARLRKLLGSGALGTLHCLIATRVNLGRHRKDENVLWSFGPHDLSMFDFLLGKSPASVAARGHSMIQPGIEDVVFLTLRYASGEMAHVHLSWLHPRKERRLTLVGSSQMAELDDVGPDKLRVYDKGRDRPPEPGELSQYLAVCDGDVHIPHVPMVEPLAAQLDHFVDCIRRGRSPLADLDSAVRVTAVLEAAQQSLARDGAPVVPAVEDHLPSRTVAPPPIPGRP